MPLTPEQRSTRARMGGHARAHLMTDEERIRAARRGQEGLRASLGGTQSALNAHMTGLALRSSISRSKRRRSTETPVPPSDLPRGGAGVDHPEEDT